MTIAPTQADGRSLPAPPQRSLNVPIGIVLFLAITYWATSTRWGIGFRPRLIIENFARGQHILAELLTPNWTFAARTTSAFIETVQIAVIAATIGCVLALPVAFLASKVTTWNRPVWAINRSTMNIVRSLPDLLYAMVFVTAIGVGPLGGILALIFFNIGVNAKLTSETIDGVDTGPIEAARASGANRLEVASKAVLPQIMPNYIAYSLYIFELNIRLSTVLGLVGAGGIGQLLLIEMRLFRYGNVIVIIMLIFLIVLCIELVSNTIKRRFI